jgi:hypothetical protein
MGSSDGSRCTRSYVNDKRNSNVYLGRLMSRIVKMFGKKSKIKSKDIIKKIDIKE